MVKIYRIKIILDEFQTVGREDEDMKGTIENLKELYSKKGMDLQDHHFDVEEDLTATLEDIEMDAICSGNQEYIEWVQSFKEDEGGEGFE